ncbi:hypothetical protein AB3S75_041268 [Citrus x aurantiifolia]
MPVMAPGTGGSLYEVLRVEPTTTISEIKTAYQSLAKVHHPDLSGNSRDFIEIHNTYETLSDPTARVVYVMSLVGQYTSLRWLQQRNCRSRYGYPISLKDPIWSNSSRAFS